MKGETTMLHRILVGLDASPLAETILEPVRVLAVRLGAEVVLLHVTHVPEMIRALEPVPGVDEVVAHEQSRAQAYLEGVARKLSAAGLAVQVALRVGEAAAEIVRYAALERIDLIALATHGRSGIQRWLYGSVADAVLHTTTTPLLLLRPTASGAPPPAEIRRLVVPLDGSKVAEAALPLAEELARTAALPIVLLRVVDVVGIAFPTDRSGAVTVDYARLLDVLQEDAEHYLGQLATDLRARGLIAETAVSIATPAEAIAAQVNGHPGSLLVLSTHGRTGWRAIVLGSMARRIIQLAAGPVLVVRPAVETHAQGNPAQVS
jgi:nucleotide-binding universal stress UspA family protein